MPGPNSGRLNPNPIWPFWVRPPAPTPAAVHVSNIKTFMGLANASTKTVEGTANASVSTWVGVTN